MTPPLSRVIGVRTETCQVYEWDIRARGLLSDPDAPTHKVSARNSSAFLIGPMKTHLKHSSVVEAIVLPLFIDIAHNHPATICTSHFSSPTGNRLPYSVHPAGSSSPFQSLVSWSQLAVGDAAHGCKCPCYSDQVFGVPPPPGTALNASPLPPFSRLQFPAMLPGAPEKCFLQVSSTVVSRALSLC